MAHMMTIMITIDNVTISIAGEIECFGSNYKKYAGVAFGLNKSRLSVFDYRDLLFIQNTAKMLPIIPFQQRNGLTSSEKVINSDFHSLLWNCISGKLTNTRYPIGGYHITLWTIVWVTVILDLTVYWSRGRRHKTKHVKISTTENEKYYRQWNRSVTDWCVRRHCANSDQRLQGNVDKPKTKLKEGISNRCLPGGALSQ